MIEYIEVREAKSRELIGIVDTAKSVIWHSVYYGAGDFEVYAPCTAENIAMLTAGNYITRSDNEDIGIIEKISVQYDPQDGRMIVASGRFAKSILDRRIIYTRSGNSVSATILRGNVETAVRKLVSDNAINCAFDSARNMSNLVLGAVAGMSAVIVDETGATAEKQVTHDELLTYSDALLEEYELGARCVLNDALKLAYIVYGGKDCSIDNTSGNSPVIFSQDFDNLLTSEYTADQTALKNTALIGGEGEGVKRFHTIIKDSALTGENRRETFVDASSLSKTYKDENDVEQTLTDAEYTQQLKSLGRQTLAGLTIIETFDGSIDLTNGSFKYGTDYSLGDIVTIQDIEIGLYINPRILEITEVQDENGYQIEAIYGK